MKATRADFFSGFFVFLIALPLCMGIAIASGFPAVAGIITAIIGGCVSSFLGSSRLTIKGPAAGLIVIVLSAVQDLGAGDLALGYRRCLAVCVVAACIQIVFALVRAGTLAELAPTTVVHGMLAAIGIIIISKQSHILMGVTPSSSKPIDLLLELPHSLLSLNPEVFFIGMLSLALLILYPRMRNNPLKRVPAPLIVLFLATILTFVFDFDHLHQYEFFGHIYHVGPKLLVNLPDHIIEALTFPDFSAIATVSSVKYVLMLSVIGSLESLLTVSAVDSLDPQRKVSHLNKDLLATGVGNLISALIGGLPMISEVVRSKANIDCGAKTYWSNVFHGLFLFVFVGFFPNILHMIPLAALSAMLLYTGYRLASPYEFIHTYHTGKDQFFIFTSTFLITLFTDLLLGVFSGIILEIILHGLRGAKIHKMFSVSAQCKRSSERSVIEVDGPLVFTNYLSLKRLIENNLVDSELVELNFKSVPIIDFTTQTKIKSLRMIVGSEKIIVSGLEHHRSLSDHQESTKLH